MVGAFHGGWGGEEVKKIEKGWPALPESGQGQQVSRRPYMALSGGSGRWSAAGVDKENP